MKKNSKLKTALSCLKLLLWAGGAMLICEYFFAYLFYFILGRDRLSEPVWTTVANAVVYAASFLAIVYVPVKLHKSKHPTRESLGLKDLPTWTDLGLVLAGFIVYLILAVILENLFSLFPFFDAEQTQELGYTLTNGFDRVVAYFALCIVAPVAEELTFRGWLYDKLRNKIPGKTLSVVLSTLLVSLLFALMHGQWNVGVNVFAMSLVLCGLREITGTTYAGILLHILKNTIAFVLVYIVGYA